MSKIKNKQQDLPLSDKQDHHDTLVRGQSEIADKLEQAVVGFLIFIARYLRTLVFVAFRPSLIRSSKSSAAVSSPYTFLALGGLMATRSLRTLLLTFALGSAAVSSCDRRDTLSEIQLPTLQEMVRLPSMVEFILVGVPLIGLAVGLAACFAGALSKSPAFTRARILRAACYALGFELFLIGLLAIPVLLLMHSESEGMSENQEQALQVTILASIVIWPSLIFARLVLIEVPIREWRMTRKIARVSLVAFSSLLIATLMAAGGFVLSRPFHLEDLRTNGDKFPNPVLVSQILYPYPSIENDEMKMTLLATNQARGVLVITSPFVEIDRNDGTTALKGHIVGMDSPILFAKGQTIALRLSFNGFNGSFEGWWYADIRFGGAYQDSTIAENNHGLKTGSIVTSPNRSNTEGEGLSE